MSADEAKGFSSAQNDDKSQKRLKLYGILVFGIIGGTAITYAVGHARRTLEWVNLQMNRGMQWSFSSKQGKSSSSQNNQQTYDGWKRYNQKIQADMDEEMERVERIRRMQSVFNRERERYKRGHQSWHENSSDAFNQQNFQRDDWYWKTDRSSSQRAEEARKLRMRAHGGYDNAHHYEVLGLDTYREKPYSQDEIKAAFRNKAMKYHPDQNQNNKEAAEAKFKEVLDSYEVLKADNEKK